MFDFLSYSFMQYALLIAIIISLSGSLLSPFLALNSQAMIADGLSHVAFSGIIISLITSGQPLYLAIPIVIVSSILITYISEQKSINSDAAIAIISSLSLAIGFIIVSKVSGFNFSIESFLVGQILTVSTTDIITSLIVMILIIIFVALLYQRLLANTFDKKYAYFSNQNNRLVKYGLSIITAIFIITSIRSVGMLLTSSLVVFPAIISIQLSKSFNRVLLNGMLISLINAFLSITISYHLGLPTAATIVVGYGLLLILAISYKRVFR